MRAVAGSVAALATALAFALPLSASLPQTLQAQAAATPAPAASLRAEISGPLAVMAETAGTTRPLAASAWRIVEFGTNRVIPVATVVPDTASRTMLVPAERLDLRKSYRLELPDASLVARVRPDGWFRTLYSGKELGANVAADGSGTTFRIFSPRATAVTLFTYTSHSATPAQATRRIALTRDEDGVWEATLPGDLHGTWYDFTVEGFPGPGTFFHGTHPVHISDPYARVQAEAHGKSRVWRATRPATPVRGGIPKMEDVVAYEVHVEDFTRQLPVSADLKGTLPAFTMTGLKNGRRQPIGFDYLTDLGVNVVHLLPMQEFLHYPEEEWQAAFKNDPRMTAWGVNERSYEWGYRTTHAFAIENTYRRAGTEHGAERDQFRDLVQAFHDRGIAVIVDIVPNHTGENMDARNMLFNWNVLDRDYHYRTDENGNHIGPFGNEVKTEERPMVQRWLIDQCLHLIREFGVDGFRIDLAGQLDEQTLKALREAVGPDIIIYGEPWIDVSDPRVRANPDWDWYKEDAPITFFQDDTRNALIGSPFRLEDKATDRGWSGGQLSERTNVMKAIENSWREEWGDTRRGLNYTDIHDNWTLADRFATRDWNGLLGVDEPEYRLSAGLLLTSLGPIVLHGGSEIMRSKGLYPIFEEVLQTATGPIYMKGRHDTYNVRTPNEFVWSDVGRTLRDGPDDFRAMHAWWRGLIRFRMSEAGAVFRVPSVQPGHVRFFTPANEGLLGYVVGSKVLVIANAGAEPGAVEGVTLPEGRWRLIADGERIDHLRGLRGADQLLTGGAALTIPAPAKALRIWVRE
jgi:pullulanase